MSLLTAEKKGLAHQREEREKGKAILIPSKFKHPDLGTCLPQLLQRELQMLLNLGPPSLTLVHL